MQSIRTQRSETRTISIAAPPRAVPPLRHLRVRLGFRAIADKAAQLPAILHEIEGHGATGELKLPETLKPLTAPGLASLPAKMKAASLRAAFDLVSSLHFIGDQSDAALTSINATMIVGARTNYAMGRDWPALRFMGGWHVARGVPTTSFVVQGVIALALLLARRGHYLWESTSRADRLGSGKKPRLARGTKHQTIHMLTIRPDGTVPALNDAGQERIFSCSTRRRFRP